MLSITLHCRPNSESRLKTNYLHISQHYALFVFMIICFRFIILHFSFPFAFIFFFRSLLVCLFLFFLFLFSFDSFFFLFLSFFLSFFLYLFLSPAIEMLNQEKGRSNYLLLSNYPFQENNDVGRNFFS